MKKIVILGGGTGLPALLKGIKYVDNIEITAIVTIADSGGSTGILSKHFDIPAVGDLRRVLASLSRDRKQLEETMEYRFKGTNTHLDGHTMGNLFLTTHILMKNDFADGIKAAAKALNIQGTVLPVSTQFNHLHAELEDGSIVSGEHNVGQSSKPIKRIFYKDGKADERAIKAILEADLIIFGIGSLYTSVLANVVYPNMIEALKNTEAKIVYFSNIFTQPGETDNMNLKEHIKAIETNTFEGILDEVIYSSTKLDKSVIKEYEDDDQFLVKNNYEKTLDFDLINVEKREKSYVRHSEEKIKKVVEKLLTIL